MAKSSGVLAHFFDLFRGREEYGHVWAIGDIQGCYSAFRKLLEKIDFDPRKDRLWIAGDLVNRGEGSLETLEYLYNIRDRIHVVLGNHDLALLAAYRGLKKSNPTLDPILNSPNADVLIEWLRAQPFVYHDPDLGYAMVHAGIPLEFDLEMALEYSQRLQKKLQGNDAPKWLGKKMIGSIDSFGLKKNRYALSAFTRMRYCDTEGRLNFDQKGAPSATTHQRGLLPWFMLKRKKPLGAKIIFGHWSTLGYVENDEVVGLDTGCVWRGKLSAKRIDVPGGPLVQVECREGIDPL